MDTIWLIYITVVNNFIFCMCFNILFIVSYVFVCKTDARANRGKYNEMVSIYNQLSPYLQVPNEFVRVHVQVQQQRVLAHDPLVHQEIGLE